MTDTKRKPTHIANAVREYGDGKTEWLKIGVAWLTENGQMVAELYAYPANGRIVFTHAERRRS